MRWLKNRKNPKLKSFGERVESVIHSAPRQVKRFAGSTEFETASRFSSMKRYISMYPEDTKTASHLWEKHYLSTLDADTSKLLKEIDKEFGTKIFMDRPLRKHELLFLRDELANFKCASGGKASFPPVLDINDFAPELRNNGFAGICVNFKLDRLNRIQGGRHIAVDRVDHAYDYKVLRHELTHYNDTKLGVRIRKAKLTDAEKQEMYDAGIVAPIRYAQKNSNELKAVWAEGSMSKYSDAIKQKMIKKGLPEWITKLDDVSMDKYLLETFKDEKSLAALGDIRQAMGGKIPNSLSINLLEHPEKLEEISRLLKIKDSHGYPALSSFTETLFSAQPERIKLIEKFAAIDVNGTKPYVDNLGVLLAEENFTLPQVEKLLAKAERSALKGEEFDMPLFFCKYFTMREKMKSKNIASKVFGNVTNITQKSI